MHTMHRHKSLINHAFATAAAVSFLIDRFDDAKEDKYWNCRSLRPPNSSNKISCCQCETNPNTQNANVNSSSSVLQTSLTASPYHNTVAASVPSKLRRTLAYFNLMELPTPRLLIPNDPVFSYPSLRRGLKQRRLDEMQLKSLEKEAMDAASTGDPNNIAKVVTKMCEIAYGKGVTPQDRQDFLIVRDCTTVSTPSHVLVLIFQNVLLLLHSIISSPNIFPPPQYFRFFFH
jgi:hypothetical protein